MSGIVLLSVLFVWERNLSSDTFYTQSVGWHQVDQLQFMFPVQWFYLVVLGLTNVRSKTKAPKTDRLKSAQRRGTISIARHAGEYTVSRLDAVGAKSTVTAAAGAATPIQSFSITWRKLNTFRVRRRTRQLSHTPPTTDTAYSRQPVDSKWHQLTTRPATSSLERLENDWRRCATVPRQPGRSGPIVRNCYVTVEKGKQGRQKGYRVTDGLARANAIRVGVFVTVMPTKERFYDGGRAAAETGDKLLCLNR
jgi:hypothetical protein